MTATENNPVAFRVHDLAVSRSHNSEQTLNITDAALYPASRENDAREYARIMGGECQPLYAVLPVSEEEASDGECKESDGCPTEKSVLQRFWREHHKTSQNTALSIPTSQP